MPKVIRLAEPEVLPPITCNRTTNCAIDLRTGDAHVVLEKCDDNFTPHGTRAAVFRLTATEVEHIDDFLVAAMLKRSEVEKPGKP